MPCVLTVIPQLGSSAANGDDEAVRALARDGGDAGGDRSLARAQEHRLGALPEHRQVEMRCRRRVAAEAFTGLLNSSRKSVFTAPSHPDARHFLSVHRLLRHPMVPAGARGMVQMALESRKIWALQVVRSAAAGWRMAPPIGAEWRT